MGASVVCTYLAPSSACVAYHKLCFVFNQSMDGMLCRGWSFYQHLGLPKHSVLSPGIHCFQKSLWKTSRATRGFEAETWQLLGKGVREKARSMPYVVNTHCGAEVFKRWPMLACDICMPSKRIVYPNNVQVLCKCHHHRFPQGADTYTCIAAWQPIDWLIGSLILFLSLSLSLIASKPTLL